MAYAAGILLGVGGVWLGIEWSLRYLAGHGVPIALWHGKWPNDDAGQKEINDRIGRAQDRALRRWRRVRPGAYLIIIVGIGLLIAAAV